MCTTNIIRVSNIIVWVFKNNGQAQIRRSFKGTTLLKAQFSSLRRVGGDPESLFLAQDDSYRAVPFSWPGNIQEERRPIPRIKAARLQTALWQDAKKKKCGVKNLSQLDIFSHPTALETVTGHIQISENTWLYNFRDRLKSMTIKPHG